MSEIRTLWYEYCKNCSYRVKVQIIGGYALITCEECGKSDITDDPTIIYEETEKGRI